MLLIKTTIKASAVEGIGLFADHEIPEGTIVWKFVPGFDQAYAPDEFARLPAPARDYLRRYATLSPNTGKYHFDGDQGRYFNHSVKPNIDTRTGAALRPIKHGEELTIDYRHFDQKFDFDLNQ